VSGTFQSVALPPLWFHLSPNRSSREQQAPRGIVIHETEGSFEGAVSWLCNPKAEASAHVVLSEDGSRAAQLVPWHEKAWHAVNANRYTLGLEMAGKTAEKNATSKLQRASRIVAFWCHQFGIPAKQGDMHGYNGIVTHRSLGLYGGGHFDPGGFDWEWFIDRCAKELAHGNFRHEWGQP
jgi:N-acetyl-anhydromuramyl-L-alanine amidase AmpD